MVNEVLSQQLLKELFNYDPVTGIFTWKVFRGGGSPKVGEVAGSVNEEGYVKIKVAGKLRAASHLAWLYMTGELPEDRVDHKNTNPSDNSWDNLREATDSENSHNKRKYKCNTTGYKGVFIAPNGRQWHARIRNKGKLKFLGTFDAPELAHEFYCLAADLLHGEFANYG